MMIVWGNLGILSPKYAYVWLLGSPKYTYLDTTLAKKA